MEGSENHVGGVLEVIAVLERQLNCAKMRLCLVLHFSLSLFFGVTPCVGEQRGEPRVSWVASLTWCAVFLVASGEETGKTFYPF